MADRVIIYGVKRGPEFVSIDDLVQMCGRTARKYDETGKVDILVEKGRNTGEMKENSEFVDDLMDSVYNGRSVIPMADLNAFFEEVYRGKIKTEEDVNEWLLKSHIPAEAFCTFINKAGEMDYIVWNFDKELTLPNITKLACKNFIPVMQSQNIIDVMNECYSKSNFSDDAMACVLATVDYDFHFRVPKNKQELYDDAECTARGYGLYGDKIKDFLLCRYLLDGPSFGLSRVVINNLKPRVLNVARFLKAINKDMGKKWNTNGFFDDLIYRLHHRISECIIELHKVGINKSAAMRMFDDGIATREQLMSRCREEIRDTYGVSL